MLNFKEEIRRFNRYYNRIMGISKRYTDESKFSATEALILYEISNKPNCTAALLCELFSLDKGYLSRILKKFEGDELLQRIPSKEDKRVFLLFITKKGEEELQKLVGGSNAIVDNLIENIPDDKKLELIESMRKIEDIFIQYYVPRQ